MKIKWNTLLFNIISIFALIWDQVLISYLVFLCFAEGWVFRLPCLTSVVTWLLLWSRSNSHFPVWARAQRSKQTYRTAGRKRELLHVCKLWHISLIIVLVLVALIKSYVMTLVTLNKPIPEYVINIFLIKCFRIWPSLIIKQFSQFTKPRWLSFSIWKETVWAAVTNFLVWFLSRITQE